MSIDLNATACQGMAECAAKMVRFPIVDLFIFFSVAPVKLSQEKEQVTYEAVLLLQIYLNLLFIHTSIYFIESFLIYSLNYSFQISMNVAAIHAKMEQHVPIMSIDFTVAVHQGTMECVVKMVRFPLCKLNYLLTVTQIKVDVKCDMVVICSFILLV